MDNLLHPRNKNKQGTNQFENKRAWYDSTYWNLIFLPLVFMSIYTIKHTHIVFGEDAHAQVISPLAVRSFTQDGKEYSIPSLNPNETEREQNQDLIKKIWGKDSRTGLNIARCESGYRTHAVNHNTNGTIDEGVFQANSVHGMPEMQNAVANISYAYTLYLKQGTNPWTSSESCWGVVLKGGE